METTLTARQAAETIDAFVTPALLLDRGRLERNIRRLAERAGKLGVTLRPHMKTAKSIDVARRVSPREPGPITVSTIAEAEYFAGHGFRDMTYAVGLSPTSARRAMELCRRTGVDLKLLLDTVEQADALADVREATGVTPSVFIELDCDDHRGGLKPDDPRLSKLADRVVAAGANLEGVLAHAGESYGLSTHDALVRAAENERLATVRAAEILRAHGHACPIVSIGSTPTAHFAGNLDGITELRAGVYMFFDLVQHGVGVCAIDDIAISVLATVIGAKPEKGWVLVDAGWMALSRDRGTASQRLDQGYGVVCDANGRVLEDVIVAQASQEHGILAIRSGSDRRMPELPVGTNVRILPKGLAAIGVEPAAEDATGGPEAATPAGETVYYHINEGTNSAGEPAAGPAAATPDTPKKRGRPKKVEPAATPAKRGRSKKVASEPAGASEPRKMRDDTKQARLIAMLRRKEGATIAQIVAATGWQPHTVRGAFAGALKKKLGLTVSSEKVEGSERVYRITAEA